VHDRIEVSLEQPDLCQDKPPAITGAKLVFLDGRRELRSRGFPHACSE
jgi:hypothetical protein